MIDTPHIRDILQEVSQACLSAESMSRQLTYLQQEVDSGKVFPETHEAEIKRLRMQIHRLLSGAKVNMKRATAEIDDEKFRFQYGEEGYKP